MENQVHIPENRNLFILKTILKTIAAYLKPQTCIHTHAHDQNIPSVFVRNDLNFITTHLLVAVRTPIKHLLSNSFPLVLWMNKWVGHFFLFFFCFWFFFRTGFHIVEAPLCWHSKIQRTSCPESNGLQVLFSLDVITWGNGYNSVYLAVRLLYFEVLF